MGKWEKQTKQISVTIHKDTLRKLFEFQNNAKDTLIRKLPTSTIITLMLDLALTNQLLSEQDLLKLYDNLNYGRKPLTPFKR